MEQDNENDISQDLIDFVTSIQNDSSNQMVIDENDQLSEETEKINVDVNLLSNNV